MKKKVLLVLMTMLLPFAKGQAQSTRCAFDSLLQRDLSENPALQRQMNAFDYGVQRFRERNSHFNFMDKPQPAPACPTCMTFDPVCFKTKYALPVIVHIVAKVNDTIPDIGSNIPDAQVYNAIADLNKKFAGYGQTDPRAANTGIQFYLAPVGPDSNGIFRYNDTLSRISINPMKFTPLRNLVDSQYNNNQYIHIFVIDSIIEQGYMGYASFPSEAFNHAVVVTRKMFGNAQNCYGCNLNPISRNKTLAHEMGHFLGLFHTFQDGCAGMDSTDCAFIGDRCCDTPPVKISNYDCPDSTTNSCSENNDLPDQIENFMDYTSEDCAKWFTRNQAERMHSALENKRLQLIDPENLYTHKPDICLFSAYFKVQNNIFCDTGGTVIFRALSYTDSGLTYHWTILDTAQNVQFDTAIADNPNLTVQLHLDRGFFTVRLQLIRWGDTATEVKNRVLWVTDCSSAIAHEAGNWFFGWGAGLVFTEIGVRPSLDALSGKTPPTINSTEGGISLSNSHGELMFYGGGFQSGLLAVGEMFNKNHEQLNNRDSMPLAISDNAAQNSLALPYPPNPAKMIILQNAAINTGKLSFTLLKIGAGGLYEIDTPTVNTPVIIPELSDSQALVIGEYLGAAPKCNAGGYWIAVTINRNNDSLHYLAILSLDTNGIHFADTFLLCHNVFSNIYNTFLSANGQAKFSPDGTKLALNKYVFDFNRADGSVTKLFELPVKAVKPTYNSLLDPAYYVYGLSFSPNSRYIYWLAEDSITKDAYTYRADLSLANPLNSIKKLGMAPDNDFYNSMQLGPDGKLYISCDGCEEIGVISYPDKEWNESPNPLGYEPYGVMLGIDGQGGASLSGLPNFVDAKSPELVKDTIYYTISDCNMVNFSTTACCYTDYLWIFGDGDTAHNKQVQHLFSEYGTFRVKLVLNHNDTLRVTVTLHAPVVNILGADTICVFGHPTPPYQALGEFSSKAEYFWSLDSGSVIPVPGMESLAYLEVNSVPAKLKVRVYDQYSQCEAVDSIMIRVSYGIFDNEINHANPYFIFSPTDSGSFTVSGSIPMGGDSSFVYEWQVSNDSLNFYAISGSDEIDIVNYFTDTIIFLRRVVFSNKCESTSNTVKVHFPLTNNFTGDTGVILLCGYSDTVHIDGTVATGGPDRIKYQWQISENDTLWTDLEGFTEQNLSLQNPIENTFVRRKAISGYLTDSGNAIWLVHKVHNNFINNHSDTLILFVYSSGGLLHIEGSIGTGIDSISYQWYYSTDSTDWHEVIGQDQRDLEHDTFSGYRWFYRVAKTLDCEIASNTVKVYPKLWNNIIGDSVVVYFCPGDSISITGTYMSGGVGNYQYKWFSSSNGTTWTQIAGAVEKDYSLANITQITYFKRRGISGSDSIESDTVQYIPRVNNNTITSHYSNYLIYYCPGSENTFTNSGSVPVIQPAGSPDYQWYYSVDSTVFEPLNDNTSQDLSMTAGDSVFFMYRKVSVLGCSAQSNTVKAIPNWKKNSITYNTCYNTSGNVELKGDYAPFIWNPPMQIFGIFYVEWKAIPNTTIQIDTIFNATDSVKAKSLNYSGAIDSFVEFKRVYSVNSYACSYNSNTLKVYNPFYLNQIEVTAGQIAGIKEIPTENFAVVWEKQCNTGNWEVINNPESFDLLGDSASFSCCNIRRGLIPLDSEGNPAGCDTFYSNVIILKNFSNINLITSVVRVGDSAVLHLTYSGTKLPPVQWQKYDDELSDWLDIEGAVSTRFAVSVDKCSANDLYRVKYFDDCNNSEAFTDSISPRVNLQKTDYFLWLKDLPSDTAEQPHSPIINNSASAFASPDMTVSNSTTITYSWGVSTTFLNGTAHLYTTVRNKGTDTSRSGKLFLYASLTGLNPEWDFSFTDEVRFVALGPLIMLGNIAPSPNPPYNLVTSGIPINKGGTDIPPIPPNDSVIVYFQWTNPPDHFVDYSLVHGGIPFSPSPRSVIYLARIEECSSSPYDMTFDEVFFSPPAQTNTARKNIGNNARIAALHSHRLPTREPSSLPFAPKPDLISDIVSVKSVVPTKISVDFASAPFFFSVGEMYVFFDDTLWDAYAAGGYNGSGYSLVEAGVFRIDAPATVFWDNIMLDVNSTGHIGFAFYYKPGIDTSGAAIESMFRVFMSQEGTETGELFLHTTSHLPGLSMKVPEGDKKDSHTQDHKQFNDNSVNRQLSVATPPSTELSLVFNVFPNPFSSELTVFAANYEPEAVITLRDMNGKTLFEASLPKEPSPSGYTLSFPAHELAEAVYFVYYQSASTHQVRKAVLVR